MTLDELIPLMARFFSARNIRYFTFGGVSVSLWGRPRTTRDLDVVICVERADFPILVTELNKLGLRVTKSLARKMAEGRIVKLPIGKTELDIKLCSTEHDLETLERAKAAKFDDFKLSVASPEDVILYKLQTWRRQDQADIENLLENAREVDLRYIEDHLGPLEEETGHPMRQRWKEIKPR